MKNQNELTQRKRKTVRYNDEPTQPKRKTVFQLLTKNWMLALFFIPFVCFDLFLFSEGIKELRTAKLSEKWVKTPATLLYSKFVEEIINDADEIEEVLHKVPSSYQYIFEGKTYENDKLIIGKSLIDFEDNTEVYQKLENVEKINIYVNPKNPTESVIVKGINEEIIMLLTLAIMLGSITAPFLVNTFYEDPPHPIKEEMYTGYKVKKKRLPLFEKTIIATLIIWAAGIYLLITIDIPIDDKIKVLEVKEINFEENNFEN